MLLSPTEKADLLGRADMLMVLVLLLSYLYYSVNSSSYLLRL